VFRGIDNPQAPKDMLVRAVDLGSFLQFSYSPLVQR